MLCGKGFAGSEMIERSTVALFEGRIGDLGSEWLVSRRGNRERTSTGRIDGFEDSNPFASRPSQIGPLQRPVGVIEGKLLVPLQVREKWAMKCLPQIQYVPCAADQQDKNGPGGRLPTAGYGFVQIVWAAGQLVDEALEGSFETQKPDGTSTVAQYVEQRLFDGTDTARQFLVVSEKQICANESELVVRPLLCILQCHANETLVDIALAESRRALVCVKFRQRHVCFVFAGQWSDFTAESTEGDLQRLAPLFL